MLAGRIGIFDTYAAFLPLLPPLVLNTARKTTAFGDDTFYVW